MKKSFIPNRQDLRRFHQTNTIFGYISPWKFLNLASEMLWRDKETIDSIEETIERNEPIEVPFLHIADHEVEYHEGRHRSLASVNQNLDVIPISISFKDYINFPNKEGYPNYEKINSIPKQDKIIETFNKEQREINLPKECTFVDRSFNEIEENKCLMRCCAIKQDGKGEDDFTCFTFRICDFHKIKPKRGK